MPLTSTMIEAGDQRLMIDCGRGTVIRMSQAGFPVGHVDTVILSHHHSDLCSGIFDLLMTGTIQQPFANRGGLKIIAIEVDHGEFIRPAYAVRVDYAGRVFVHSHDTRCNENLIAQAKGADGFVHEIAAGTPETFRKNPKAKIATDHHATPDGVGRVFAQTRPKLGMLTHIALLPLGSRPTTLPICTRCGASRW